MASSGTVMKRFIGPWCYTRASLASEDLTDAGFSIALFNNRSWKNPRTWFCTDFEACYSFRDLTSYEVLGRVKSLFAISLGWRLHPSTS